MKEDDDLSYRIREMTKRKDLPIDVVRILSEAYERIESQKRSLSKYALDEFSRLDDKIGLE
jgi:hypothetical protein